jgi:Ca-activated chloride channel homolog
MKKHHHIPSIIRTCLLAVLVGVSSLSGKAGEGADLNVSVKAAHDYLPDYESNTTYLRVDLDVKRHPSIRRPAVNIALVIDKSGSMQGTKLEDAKQSAILFIQRLAPQDIVSVITYSSSAQVLVPATRATDKGSIIRLIQGIRADGSTALFAGVSKGAAEVRKFAEEQRVQRIVLLSDGLANQGPSTPQELGQLGRSLVREGISVSTMGIGYGYNEDLMAQLAFNSDGNHVFVENSDQLAGIFESELNDIFGISAQRLKITIQCSDDLKILRVLGRDATIRGQQAEIFLNQLSSASDPYLLLEVQNLPETKTREAIARVDVTWLDPFTRMEQSRSSSLKLPRTSDRASIEASMNPTVIEAATLQIAAINTEEAIALRDAGRISEARMKFEENQAMFEQAVQQVDSDTLRAGISASSSDAKGVSDEAVWSRQRKVLREEQMSLKTNQAVPSPANRYAAPQKDAQASEPEKKPEGSNP